MSKRVKLREKIRTLLILFMFFETVLSKCEVYLSELHTPIVPFKNEIPANYSMQGEFEPSFDEFFKESKSHQNNYFEFQRYCTNLNDQNSGNYGFAVIEIHDNMELRPIIHQYFKFNDSNFNNGILMVGNLNTKNFSEIEIQKMSYQTFLVKDKFLNRKYSISKNYVFLMFEITPKTSWIDVHFAYGEKYVSLQKIDTLIEDSIDAFILSEEYGVDWLKKLMSKLNIPTFHFDASLIQSWTRCCNNWFMSKATPGAENSCCSTELKILPHKGLPPNYRESSICRIPGCLLIEGGNVKIKGNDQTDIMATVAEIGEKAVQLKYVKDGKSADIVYNYDKLFQTHLHITLLNCATELPEIVDIDNIIKTQPVFDKRTLRNEIIFCFFNETSKEKMCGRFWIGQNITVPDGNGKTITEIIGNIFTNSNVIFVKIPGGTRTISFDILKSYNPQNFERKDCIVPPQNLILTKSINRGTFNRSLAMSKLIPTEQKINVSTTADDKIHSGTIIKFSKMHAVITDPENDRILRQPYDKIILENPSIFDKMKSDEAVELYYTDATSGKNFSTLLNLNQSQSYVFYYNGKNYIGVINEIFGDIGFVMMNATDHQENVPITIEDIHFLNNKLFKEKVTPIPCVGFKGKRFRIHHSHQRKKSDCPN